MELGIYLTSIQRAVNFATTGDKLLIAPPRPVDILRFGAVISTAPSTNGTLILKKRAVAGDAGTESTIGTITLTDLSRVQGSVNFFDVDGDDKEVLPGGEYVVEVTVGSTGGLGEIFVDIQPRGFHKNDKTTDYYANLFDFTPPAA